MSPIPLNKSNMSSFEELKNCEQLVQVLSSRSQACQTCRKREFVDHLHFIVDEGCLLNPTDGIPDLVDIRCGHCQATQALKSCNKCGNEFYCNKACQKNHWSQHSKSCSTLKAVPKAQETATNVLSNGSVHNGNNSIHVASPLAQPVKPRSAVNTGDKVSARAGKGDLVRVAGDEVDKTKILPVEVQISKPESKKIAKIDLKNNDKFEFLLTFGSNPSNFYIQRSSDAEKAGFITECLNRECPKLKSWEEVKFLEVGQFCAGLYDTDQNWYRAKLLQKNGDEYHISFIDFGNPDTVKAVNLRPLPVELIDTPALAIHCKLHDLKPNKDGDWSEESVAVFGTEVESGKFVDCQVNNCNKDGIYSVDLFTNSGDSISEKMIKMKLATRVSVVLNVKEKNSPKMSQKSDPKIAENPQQITIQSSPKIKESSESIRLTTKPMEKAINIGNVVSTASIPITNAPKSAKISLGNLRKLRKPESKIRSYVDELDVSSKPISAIFTSIFDKTNGKLCIMFNVEMFCEINTKLTELFEQGKVQPLIDAEVGKYVVVKEDEEWHRAYVLKMNEKRSHDCLLLDVGFVGTYDDVYALPSHLIDKPSLFVLATALGEASKNALKNIKCEEPTSVSLVIAKKDDEILARVKFDDSIECNMSLKSYTKAIREITQSLEKIDPLETMPIVTLDGGSQSVLVVYQSPTNLATFFVVPNVDEIGKIMEELPIKQRLGKPIESPEVGTYCLALSEDGEFYRAVVTELNESNCRVYFVDFGNEDVVANNKLLSIEPDFSPKSLPAQAVKCVLSDRCCNEKNYQAITKAMEGSVLRVFVYSKAKDHYVVEI